MKHHRRLAVLLLAFMLTLALATAAGAADITISGGNNGAAYAAFRLLDAAENTDNSITYSVNDKYKDILAQVLNITDATDDDIIAAVRAKGSGDIQDFADAVYGIINSSSVSYDAATSSGSFQDIQQGYYLIAQTLTPSSAAYTSLIMLDTLGNSSITVTPKSVDTPTCTIKIIDSESSSQVDAVDSAAGDTIKFIITGKLPQDIGSFNSYTYKFHCDIPDGLTLIYDSTNNDDDGRSLDISLKLDGARFNAEYQNIVTSSNGFTVDVQSITSLFGRAITETSVFTVEFSAKLNSSAASGINGNPVTANIEYSSSKYNTTETRSSVADKAAVFTYDAIFNVQDSTNTAVSGAVFTLYKVAGGAEASIGNSTVTSGQLEFKGLDSGSYKLVNTTAPLGYKKAADLSFKITGEFEANSDNPQLSRVIVTDDRNNDINTGTHDIAVNLLLEKDGKTGIELPATGGVGAAVYYISGALLVFLSLALLARARRT